MAKETGDLIPGTLDMLVLKALQLESMHGWGITERIEQWSKHDGSHTFARPLPTEVVLDLSAAPRLGAERQDPETEFAQIPQDLLTSGTTHSVGYLTHLLVYLVGLWDK